MSSDERRIHARMECDLGCSLSTDEGIWSGRVHDLSHGGAQVRAPAGIAQLGESLALEIEVPLSEEPISILGEVCRVVDEGVDASYGVRFSVIEPAQKDLLVRYIDSLIDGEGIRGRQHPRVYRRVEVVCKTAAQTRAVMSNISKGGLALQCQVPLVLDEQITVEVLIERFPEPIELRGTVAHVRTVGDKLYHAGVRFERLSPEREKALGDLIAFLLRSAER